MITFKNAYVLRDREDGEITIKAYTDKESEWMMRQVSKHLAFDDLDDTFEIICIIYKGRQVRYTGWQPGMVMEFADGDGDIVYSICRPDWDH